MRAAALVLAALALSGCAVVRYADGQRVAIEYEHKDPKDLQAQADEACIRSGGKAPATLISAQPLHTALPAAMVRHTATFRCS